MTVSDPGGVAVVVCVYTLDRRDDIVRCIRSLQDQTRRPDEIVVVADHNPELEDWLRAALEPSVRAVPNTGPRGLSGARNAGIAATTRRVVAFMDDDAVADPGWLAALLRALSRDEVIAAGGHSLPAWEGVRPGWFPDEFLWVVGCSFRGMVRGGPTRNGLGGCMAFRSDVFARVGGFDPSVGRLGALPVGGEETELCIRAQRRSPDAVITIVEDSILYHRVPAGRQRFGYFVRRCFHEGMSKALIRRLSDSAALGPERSFAMRTVPAGIVRELAADVGRGRPGHGTLRAVAIAAGSVATAVGYAAGSAALRLRRSRPVAPMALAHGGA